MKKKNRRTALPALSFLIPVSMIMMMGMKNASRNDTLMRPEGIYYVINGKHFDNGCCFDYGNSSTNGRAVGTGTIETAYYGTATAWTI